MSAPEEDSQEPMDEPLKSQIEDEKYKTLTAPTQGTHLIPSNNHHVVPVGVLIVLFTLYLTSTALNVNLLQISQDSKQIEEIESIEKDVQENQRRSMILNRFLEYENFCTDLEIFTSKLPQNYEVVDEMEGDSAKDIANDQKKSDNPKFPLKAKANLTGKNGGSHKYNNKSSKMKYVKKIEVSSNAKKDQQDKKNSTAEPIIYLFALVFIYLLLKAASDINQHYKSQTKGDKRLRRCSLQSYAQTHKQDRRASKDSPIKYRQQRLMDYRSSSVDRYTTTTNATLTLNAAKKLEILANLRKYTSMDEPRLGLSYDLWHETLPAAGSVELGSRTFKDTILLPSSLSSSISSNTNRRCSVPATLNYQRSKLTNTTMVAPLSVSAVAKLDRRRTSITSGLIGANCQVGGQNLDNPDGLFPEIKRRVRMINRH